MIFSRRGPGVPELGTRSIYVYIIYISEHASATASTRDTINRNPCPICGLACVSMHVAMRAVAQARRGLGASACVCFTVGETALTCEEFPVPLESVSHGSVAEAAPAPLGV